jgi:exonuclease III
MLFMRIVSWNCGGRYYGGFTKKAKFISDYYKPDILVVQECTQKECTDLQTEWSNPVWHNDDVDNSSQGIGIFAKTDYKIECISDFDKSFRYVVPYRVTGVKQPFTLIAVWTQQMDSTGVKYENYHVPVRKALDVLKNYKFENSIIIGDFNTGADKSDSKQWYTNLATEMKRADLKNCAGEDGQELCPTFFRGNGSWLDDHCFATSDIKVISFGIGNKDYWMQYSDHCPLIVDFDW